MENKKTKTAFFSFLSTLLISTITSGLVATVVTANLSKNSELETRTYELKYETYSAFNNELAELDDLLWHGTEDEIRTQVRKIHKMLPNLLLVTQDRNIIFKLDEIAMEITEPSNNFIFHASAPLEHKKEEKQKDEIGAMISRLNLMLVNDFSNFVLTDAEMDSFFEKKEAVKEEISNKIKTLSN